MHFRLRNAHICPSWDLGLAVSAHTPVYRDEHAHPGGGWLTSSKTILLRYEPYFSLQPLRFGCWCKNPDGWVAGGGSLFTFAEFYSCWNIYLSANTRLETNGYSTFGDWRVILNLFSDMNSVIVNVIASHCFLNMFMTSESMGIWISRAHHFSFLEGGGKGI